MRDSWIQTYYFWLPNRVGIQQTLIIQDPNVSADVSARYG